MRRSGFYYEQAYQCSRLASRAIDPVTRVRLMEMAEANAAMGKGLAQSKAPKVDSDEGPTANNDLWAASVMALVLLFGAAALTFIPF